MWNEFHATLFIHHRLELHIADPEDSDFGCVEHRREAFNARRTQIGDGERSAGQFVGINRAFRAGFSKALGFRRDVFKREFIGEANHRNHQAARRIDSEPEVYVFELHHFFAEPIGVKIGEFNDGLCNRIENQIVDGDARFILGRFKLFASGENRARIGGGIHRELRGGLHRTEHPLRNQFADSFNLNFFQRTHALFTIRDFRNCWCGRCGDSRRLNVSR